MESSLPNSVQRLVRVLQDMHGTEILVMDLRKLTDTTDYFILCTGNSDPHVRALADEVCEQSKLAGDPPWHIEGYATRRWILVDFVHVVVHLFRREAREFYALERLWGDAPFTRFEDELDRVDPSEVPPVSSDVDSVFARP